MARLVRDLSRQFGKRVEMETIGEDIELDRTIVEELADPLMHMVRNALDHGIESSEERARAGKPAIGRITLTAYQQGNSVVIDVRDDGRGIDPQQIRKAALQRDRAANRIDNTCELYENAVAGRLDNAAAMGLDLRINELPPQGAQSL